ncbi:nickel-responsive transcriptional regulator NikR [Budvicia aquatica]|uniref:Nickel-responsive regulator n=1 Tax=Budvicia aquatica TaxID=82979 RepID=A0A2C6DNY2_9GAMM|nr:nickel-responsive transcriptional regulator NikR [Budvicia aquatica]PHI30403.1 nickel-responsive transcriptional regulator NikR [Budvicia aquatica]VFS49563.1 Nickel-responsive regulator [Budvicia aquatica]
MHRITISIDDDLMEEIDKIIKQKNYQNRSEAIRDLTRTGIQNSSLSVEGNPPCVGALVYVYDHESRELSKRLTRTFHDQHNMTLASLHVHLDHGSCMEVSMLKGNTDEVERLAEQVITERGVRYGKLIMVPDNSTAHGEDGHHHGHSDEHE